MPQDTINMNSSMASCLTAETSAVWAIFGGKTSPSKNWSHFISTISVDRWMIGEYAQKLMTNGWNSKLAGVL